MIEFIFERYNYWAVIFLMMIGLYITFQAGNMIKRMVGLSVFQTSVFLFYITLGKVNGGSAPILFGKDDPHGAEHGAEHGAGHGDAAASFPHTGTDGAVGDDLRKFDVAALWECLVILETRAVGADVESLDMVNEDHIVWVAHAHKQGLAATGDI